jgi:hypothetical protein
MPERELIQTLLFDDAAVRLEPKAGAKHRSGRQPANSSSDEQVFLTKRFIAAARRMEGGELKVYLNLRAKAIGGQVTGMTLEDLAAAAGLSSRMVLKALKSLAAGNWIRRFNRPGRLSNVYAFPDGAAWRCGPKAARA